MREFKSATGFNWTGKAVLPGSLSILCVCLCVCTRLLMTTDYSTGAGRLANGFLFQELIRNNTTFINILIDIHTLHIVQTKRSQTRRTRRVTILGCYSQFLGI